MPLPFRVARALALATAFASLAATTAASAQQSVGTAAVFRRHSDRVVRIQVVESGSAAKSTLGSGFFVGDRGLVITNYHVISRLVTDSARHRAELTDTRGATHPVRVLAIDVVHDLAVVQFDGTPATWFDVQPVALDQGERLYALGHPLDLGLTIAEGTYNGELKYVLYPKILFSGALNPGMSGGPTIDAQGRVVGVNVSTAGNEISFLVPVDRVLALLRRVDEGRASGSALLKDAALQLRAYQDSYIARVFSDSVKRVTLGRFSLPTEPAPFFKCWADADRDEEDPYEIVHHQCSTDDYVFISGEQSTGLMSLSHRLLINKSLNPFRFHALYTSSFDHSFDAIIPHADAHAVTPYRCETRNVRHDRVALRAVFCVRKHRKLEGLYDAFVKAAVLGSSETGLVTTLSLSGVTFENAHALARRYLEQIAWNDE
jgi:serine protease Do